jgi:hypothetical protein
MPMNSYGIKLKWCCEYTCPHVLGFTFGYENYKRVSSNWYQLVLFNKMITILRLVRTLLTNLHTTRNP